MKKAGLFIVLLLLLSLIPLISAQEEAPGIGEAPLVSEVQQGQEAYQQYTTAENKSEYLKQEWVEILGKANYIGPVVKGIDKVFTFLSPFFKIVLGVESKLSWAFIFAIAIWLILFFFLNPIMSQLLNKGSLGLVSSFIIASLVGLSGVIKMAVDLLTLMINNVWIAWLSLLVAIILVFLAEVIGKKIKAKIKKAKEAEEARKTAEAQKLTQVAGEVAKKELESFDQGAGI
jgi:Na+-transporting methylmalonyl-CoA/oxaloacetate decarboxylase gamma subunit